jgi:hypothetical protein
MSSAGSAEPALALPASPLAAAPWRARVQAAAPALVLVCYLVGAIALTSHLWASPSTATVTGNPNDASQFAWFMRYTASAVSHLRVPSLTTQAMNAPTGISLLWNVSLLLPGTLLTPVTVLAGPQVSLTVLLTAGFAGSAASQFWVLRRWGVSLPAAAVGGAVFGFSPALTHAAIGHYNLQFAVGVPLLADAVLRLVTGRGRPVPTGLWLGALVAAQLFTSEELLLDATIGTVIMATAVVASRPGQIAGNARGAVAGLAVACATVLVLAGWALRAQFFGPLTEHGSAFEIDFFKNDLLGFVTASGMEVLHSGASAAAAARYQGGAPEYLAYLGLPLLVVLAAIAVAGWRHLPVRAVAVTFAVLELLSLGAHPLVGGTVDTGVTLPWSWLEGLPVVGAALPTRLSIVADAAAGALLALGIDLARRRLGHGRSATTLIAVIAAFAVLPLVPLPLPATPATPPPPAWATVLGALRLTTGARVLVVPVPTATLTAALRWQATGGQPIQLIGGYFEGPDQTGQTFIDGGGLPSLAYYLDDLWQGNAASAAPSPAEAHATLAYWNPDAVVADASSLSVVGRYLTGLLGPPTLIVGGMTAWRLEGLSSHGTSAARSHHGEAEWRSPG